MPKLCFGGSFNPIHYGHLRCAQAVAEKAGYDRVVLIPSGRPPHKRDVGPILRDLAAAPDRLAMAHLAVSGSPLFEVSDIETRSSGPSYTIDTAQMLRDRGWERVNWLIGADMLLSLPNWHRPLDLVRQVHFVVMARPGWPIDWSALPPEFRHLRKRVVEAPMIDISATDIRRRVRAGEPIADLVPPAVEQYIRDHGLYRA
jgi:nicotinate-nucleotide adenylyltransferase